MQQKAFSGSIGDHEFLSPKIVEAIAEGRQPPDLTVLHLTRGIDLPLLWRAQEQAIGINNRAKTL